MAACWTRPVGERQTRTVPALVSFSAGYRHHSEPLLKRFLDHPRVGRVHNTGSCHDSAKTIRTTGRWKGTGQGPCARQQGGSCSPYAPRDLKMPASSPTETKVVRENSFPVFLEEGGPPDKTMPVSLLGHQCRVVPRFTLSVVVVIRGVWGPYLIGQPVVVVRGLVAPAPWCGVWLLNVGGPNHCWLGPRP